MTFTGPGIVIITALIGALSTVVAFLFRQLMTAQAARYDAVMATKDAAFLTVVATKDAAQSEMKVDRDNYRRMALQAALVLDAKVNRERHARGLADFDPMAPVVPEHNSPTTRRQQEEAEFATLRAQIAAAALALGIEVPDVHDSAEVGAGDRPDVVKREAEAPVGVPVAIHHAIVIGMSGADDDPEHPVTRTTIIDATITGTVQPR